MTRSTWCALARTGVLLGTLLVVVGVAVAQNQPEYKLGPEDVIRIVAGNQDFTAKIGSGGKVLVPPLNTEVQAAGLTERQLAAELTERFRIRQRSTPDVVVIVQECNSRSVTVLGEVHTPGRLPLCVIPDVWEIINKAGGPTPSADLGHVYITRKEGEPRIVTIDLSSASTGKMPQSLPEVRPLDTITVPTAGSEATAVSGASFQVLGAVHAPSVYPLSRASTIIEALAVAGGPLPEANLKKVALTRDSGGSLVSYKLNLHALLYEGEANANLDLQAGDTVTIPTKVFGPGTVGRGLVLFLPLITSITSLIVIAR